MVATLVQEWILAIILVHTKTLMVTLFLGATMLALMMMLVQEQAILVQEWIFLMILTWLMAATVVQEWTLAMILVHAKALMVTLVVMVSPVVYSGDDTAIDYRMREHWYRNGL